MTAGRTSDQRRRRVVAAEARRAALAEPRDRRSRRRASPGRRRRPGAPSIRRTLPVVSVAPARRRRREGVLRPLVLGVGVQAGPVLQRLGHRRRVEDELDHLPVALVAVVPVVVDVVQPVLGDEARRRRRRPARTRPGRRPSTGTTARSRSRGRGRRPAGRAPVRPAAGEVVGRRRRGDDLAVAVAQHDVVATEHVVDGDRVVRLTVAARARLLAQRERPVRSARAARSGRRPSA